MKNILLSFFFLNICMIIYAQDATLVYEKTANSTVTIETDIGMGSGFFVGKNIIATNYHVIEGASTADCYLCNSTIKYKIDGYLAFDKETDLILLQVSGLNMPALSMSSISVIPGQKVFVIGTPIGLPATISDGIVSGLRDYRGVKLIQITAPISHGSSGGPVLNSQGQLIGISVGHLRDGQNLNFAIPKINLEHLINRKKSYSIPLTTLNSPEAEINEMTPAFTGNKKIYKIGVFNNGNQALSLDYYANVGEYSLFFITCHKSRETFQRAINHKYRLVNVETGDIYHSVIRGGSYNTSPVTSANDNSLRFCIWFEKIPSGGNLLSLMDGDCNQYSFCFLYLNLVEYREVNEFDISSYIGTSY